MPMLLLMGIDEVDWDDRCLCQASLVHRISVSPLALCFRITAGRLLSLAASHSYLMRGQATQLTSRLITVFLTAVRARHFLYRAI